MKADKLNDMVSPKIAFVVYNDVHGDTRVLKVARTLKNRGASVRIFAASSETGRYPDGLDTSLEDLEIFRLPTLPLQRLARRLRGATSPAGTVTTRIAPELASKASRAKHAWWVARTERVISASYSVLMQWLFWRRVVKHITSFGPAVVHAHDANTLPAAVRAARRAGSQLIYDSHELWTDRNVVQPRPFRNRLDKVIETRGIAKADAVITVSPSIAKYLQDTYRLRESPVLVRNVPPFAGDVTPLGKLRQLANLDQQTRVVAYCGSITTNRGIESTVNALRYLSDDTHLVLLGEGQASYISTLRELASENRISERVHFVGRVPSEEVPATLADADVSVVFTVPICRSYLWSLPNKLFESIHAGLPIVASDLPDVSELVTTTGVGKTVALDDEKLLADTIEVVLSNSSLYRENSRRAAKTLNWQDESTRLLSVYQSLINWPTQTLN